MGLYEQANNSAKSLEMARDVLKYDPDNPPALVTAALILANGARDSDLDRNARLDEAKADALSALHSLGTLDESSGLSAEQLGDLSGQLSGAAHEALGTVAFKKLDFPTALKEYFIAATEQKQNADPVVWLRMSVAYEKTGNLSMSSDAAERALHASAAGSRIRELAEKQKAHVQKKIAASPAEEDAATPAAAQTDPR
jgi:tetratricopeptide (TPR) repeat protein